MRSKSKRAQLSSDFKRIGVKICCIQETYIIANDYEGVLSKGFSFFSAYFDSCLRSVSWLTSHSLNATCSLVFVDQAGRLCVLRVTIKEKVF